MHISLFHLLHFLLVPVDISVWCPLSKLLLNYLINDIFELVEGFGRLFEHTFLLEL